MGKGRLLLVSACLEGDPKERPAAYFLKQAILSYVSSESFAPTGELSREEIEENLFPLGRMEEIVEDWDTNEDTTVSRKEALFGSQSQHISTAGADRISCDGSFLYEGERKSSRTVVPAGAKRQGPRGFPEGL